MTEIVEYLWKYVKALGFISALICVILGIDVSELEESTTAGMLLYCFLLGSLIIQSVCYTYDFIKTFYKE